MADGRGRRTAPLVLEPEEREYLERQVRQRRVARSMSERCRIILRCADGIQGKVCERIGLSNEEWLLIGPLLPAERERGCRPAGDDRPFFEGIMRIARTGAQ